MGLTVSVLQSSNLPTKHTHTHTLLHLRYLSIYLYRPQPGRAFICNCLLLSFQHGRSAAHYCLNMPSRESVDVFSVFCDSAPSGLVVFSNTPKHAPHREVVKKTRTGLFNSHSCRCTLFLFRLVSFFVCKHCCNGVCWTECSRNSLASLLSHLLWAHVCSMSACMHVLTSTHMMACGHGYSHRRAQTVLFGRNVDTCSNFIWTDVEFEKMVPYLFKWHAGLNMCEGRRVLCGPVRGWWEE